MNAASYELFRLLAFRGADEGGVGLYWSYSPDRKRRLEFDFRVSPPLFSRNYSRPVAADTPEDVRAAFRWLDMGQE